MTEVVSAGLVGAVGIMGIASRVAVAKLRLDGTPTPRSLGGSDDEAADPDRDRQERLPTTEARPFGSPAMSTIHFRGS